MNWHLLTPECLLVACALLLLAMECFRTTRGAAWLSALALGGVGLASWALWHQRHLVGTASHGMYLFDPLAVALKFLFLATTAVVILLTHAFVSREPRLRGAFYLLILLASVGMQILASAGDLLLVFIALELMTFSFYVMTAYVRTDARSIEAGLKYLILGAVASGFLLFGTSFIYGVTGSTRFAHLHAHLQQQAASPLLLFGGLCVLAGLGFKLSAVPFHWWVPDVYHGAPTPVTAFLAAGSKAAGFAVLMRLMHPLFGPLLDEEWVPLVALAAALTMCYGNLAAIPQTNIKRLLGYSSIGHAGYLLMGMAAMSSEGVSAVVFYLVAYAAMTLLAFAVVIGVSNAVGSEELAAYEGLSTTSPFLAATLFLALLALAGVPPLVGFFGKLWLLLAAVERGLIWLAVVGVVNVVISLYYYLLVVKRMYLMPAKQSTPVAVSLPLKITAYAGIAAILLLGIFQQPLVIFALHATQRL